MDVTVTWSQRSTDSHKQEMVFLCTELYRTPKSHIHNNDCDQNYHRNFITQPNDISLDCQVFRLPFWMAWQYYDPKMILGVHRDRMHESKVSLDGFTIRKSRSPHASLE